MGAKLFIKPKPHGRKRPVSEHVAERFLTVQIPLAAARGYGEGRQIYEINQELAERIRIRPKVVA
jgi:hypothetical protein